MQQKPYAGESKRYRYVFLPIENFPRLKEKMNAIKDKQIWEKEDDLVINVRTDYEVVMQVNKDKGSQSCLLEIKVVPVEDKMKIVSQIDIGNARNFAEMLNTLDI